MSIRVVEFKTEYRTGKPPVDMVLIAPIGENFEKVRTWLRINEMRPPQNVDDVMAASPSYQSMISRWEVVSRAYEAWKNSTDIPEDGTPLAAWSGVTAEQAQLLRRMGVLTVENVANMSGEAVAGLPWPNARKLPQMAKDYLSGQSTAEKDALISEMQERMAAMEAMLAEKLETEVKRGPGRPRKEEAA
jgi:hypothetical protein